MLCLYIKICAFVWGREEMKPTNIQMGLTNNPTDNDAIVQLI